MGDTGNHRWLRVVGIVVAIVVIVGQGAALAWTWVRYDNRTDSLAQSLHSQTAENATLRHDLAELQAERDDLANDLSRAEAKIQALEIELEEARTTDQIPTSVVPPYVSPDPSAVRLAIRELFTDVLGREPRDSELEALTSEYLALDRQAYEALQDGQVQDVDARFIEYFESTYAGEIQRIKDVEESRRSQEIVTDTLDCLDALISGEDCP